MGRHFKYETQSLIVGIKEVSMAKNIRGNNDGTNGENDSYTIAGRGVVDRQTLVNETRNGNHPNHHVVRINGEDYVRANPDAKNSNNINK